MHVCGTIRTPTACPVVKSRKTEIQACVEPSSPHTWLHNFTPNGVSHTKSNVADFSKTILA